jgi:hypothetical protein
MVTRITTLAAILSLAPGTALAEPLAFSPEPGPALNIASTLMSQERGEPFRDDEVVSIALVDLDNDGTSEIFAFAGSSYFCGSAGCVPRLYRLDRTTAKWHELPIEADAMINAGPENWSVTPATAGEWSTLELSTEVLRLTFEWNGEAFAAIE